MPQRLRDRGPRIDLLSMHRMETHHQHPTNLQLYMRICSISARTASCDNGNKMKKSVAEARGSEPGTSKSLKV
jgi:hypothetical protein